MAVGKKTVAKYLTTKTYFGRQKNLFRRYKSLQELSFIQSY
jgi:hypothetical protein